jgi:calcineurin-like phosphoesterase family protein
MYFHHHLSTYTFTMLRLTLLLACCLSCCLLFAQEASPFIPIDDLDDEKPWTHEKFYHDPEAFQFAIVSDRTGGHRPGVFGKAMGKLNLLQPEFVMCVGDLIEGYTEDNAIIDEQWDEFYKILKPLEAPFFFLPGNHDISNQTMREQWQQRFGRSYYAFLYHNVLFICMDSNDGDGVTLSDAQISYVKEVISQHTDVRWTMLLLHHPIWDYQDLSGFQEIELALEGRDYTVIAGHRHSYMYEERKGQNYLTLATTGGGSQLRGASFGEYDHIVWVTMTKDRGPVLVNVAVDGIIEKNIVTPEKRTLAQQLISASNMPVEVLLSENASKGEVRWLLKNESALPINFRGFLLHHHQLLADQSRWEVSIPAHAEKEVVFSLQSIENKDISGSEPLVLDWEMAYQADSLQDMVLSGQEMLKVVRQAPLEIMPAQNKFLESTEISLVYPFSDAEIRYTLDGREPDIHAVLYQGPIKLDDSYELKARVYRQGFAGPVQGVGYEKVEPLKAQKLRKPEKGLQFEFFEGEWKSLPDFTALEPIRTGVADHLDVEQIAGKREDHFALKFTGFIKVEEEAMYTFRLHSDDGARIYIADQLVVDNDGSHSASSNDGYIALKAGFHPVEVQYFEDFLGETLDIWFKKENAESFQSIEDFIFY